jgi:GH15 family glucan-1,4-alpha-glucosidase
LVGRDGAIDWLCWPRFDSGACFAALLGTRDNGRWLIGAADPVARVSRHYRDTTLILETEIETADGAVSVIDFMPPRGKNSDVVRLVRGKRGRVAMRTELIVRFDYGSLVPWVTQPDGGAWRAVGGPDMVVLRTPVELRGKDFTTVGEFTVAAGETVPFVLTYGPSHLALPGAIDAAQALRETETFWRAWRSRPGDGRRRCSAR